jgi:hypothetical protein
MGGFFPLLDPLLRCPALVVEADDRSHASQTAGARPAVASADRVTAR